MHPAKAKHACKVAAFVVTFLAAVVWLLQPAAESPVASAPWNNLLTPAVFWVATAVGALGIGAYLAALAIDWFLDAEHRALEMWLDQHSKNLSEDDK